jgi:hypothetical protein
MIPHYLDKRLTDGGKAVSPTHRSRSTPQKHYFSASGTHFCYRLSKPQVLVWLKGWGKLKKFYSVHRISNPRSFALLHSVLPSTLTYIKMNAIVQFEVLRAIIMKSSIFFTRSFGMSVDFKRAAECHIPEDISVQSMQFFTCMLGWSWTHRDAPVQCSRQPFSKIHYCLVLPRFQSNIFYKHALSNTPYNFLLTILHRNLIISIKLCLKEIYTYSWNTKQ